jgi:peptide/nickel transport system permease protein
VMAYLLVTAIFIIFFNLVADLLYGSLDPRIRYD